MSLDLSNAAKLRHLMFPCRMENIGWIATALRTVESENLQRITFRMYPAFDGDSSEGADRLELQDLDRTLVQFWFSHSIRPRFVFAPGDREEDMRDRVSRFFPELTRRGLAEVVEQTFSFIRDTMRLEWA